MNLGFERYRLVNNSYGWPTFRAALCVQIDYFRVARLNEAFAADAFACSVSAVCL